MPRRTLKGFSEALVQARTTAGDSRRDLARTLDLHDTSIGYWERGTYAPSLLNFERLVALYPQLEPWRRIAKRSAPGPGYTAEMRAEAPEAEASEAEAPEAEAPEDEPVPAPAPAPAPTRKAIGEAGVAYALALRTAARRSQEHDEASQRLLQAQIALAHANAKAEAALAILNALIDGR